MKHLTTLIFVIAAFSGKSQVANFDELQLQPDTFWYATDQITDNFTSGGVYCPSWWSTEFGGYWAGGFAYSNMTDTVTSGFLNAFSAKAGHGFNMSPNYVVTYSDGWFSFEADNGVSDVSMYLTNNTFAYNSMLEGDGIGKKFGGPSGNDPDYFSVTFQGYFQGALTGVPIEFYLADFRADISANDYILKSWTQANLSAMGIVDSVTYFFRSSDEGNFGINTPTYFCADRIAYNEILTNGKQPELYAQIFPNPSHGMLNLRVSGNTETHFDLFSMDGKLVLTGNFNMQLSLSTAQLAKGCYFIKLSQGNLSSTSKLILQ